jgi:putative nucleotidyltransferase with HDIG domain
MKFGREFTDNQSYVDAISEYMPIIRLIASEKLRVQTAKVWVTTEGTYQVAKLMNEYQNMNLDLDMCIVLGMLHDVSKYLEFEPDGQGGVRRSEIGKNIQHGVIGAWYAREAGFSLVFQQLIISHTPMSNIKPCNREGTLFGMIDLADADQLEYGRVPVLWADRIKL